MKKRILNFKREIIANLDNSSMQNYAGAGDTVYSACPTKCLISNFDNCGQTADTVCYCTPTYACLSVEPGCVKTQVTTCQTSYIPDCNTVLLP
ncbi:MAG: hypothetical protein ACEPOV_06415 [Hyphomicrobiales bacterium]